MLSEDPGLQAFVERVESARANGSALCIRGGGTKEFYGEAPYGELLDTRTLSGISSYEPSELVVTARCGTPLAELEQALREQGQCLAFEPPRHGAGGTVGGMVAAGLAGPSRAAVGSVRDYVLGATLLSGKGEVLSFGGQVIKNVAGYDVSRLLAGSMGTLGLILEVSLKVLPSTPGNATLSFDLDQATALERLNLWGGQPLPLNASCWLEENGTGTLYLRLRGAVAAVEAACNKLGGERMPNAQAAPDWQHARDHQLPWFKERKDTQDLWRLSLPQTTPVLDLPNSQLIEWHGGQRWVRADAAQGQQLRSMAKNAGGYATLFIAACARKQEATGRFDTLKSPLDRIHRELKREFDPVGVFNPHRMHRDW